MSLPGFCVSHNATRLLLLMQMKSRGRLGLTCARCGQRMADKTGDVAEMRCRLPPWVSGSLIVDSNPWWDGGVVVDTKTTTSLSFRKALQRSSSPLPSASAALASVLVAQDRPHAHAFAPASSPHARPCVAHTPVSSSSLT
jgi:hypothetical protein